MPIALILRIYTEPFVCEVGCRFTFLGAVCIRPSTELLQMNGLRGYLTRQLCVEGISTWLSTQKANALTLARELFSPQYNLPKHAIICLLETMKSCYENLVREVLF